MCQYQSYLWILWLMQKKVQSEAMENILGCFQCYASCSVDWWENIMYAWWIESGFEKFATNFEHTQTYRNPGWRTTLRSTVVRSLENSDRLVNEHIKRNKQNIRFRHHIKIPLVTKPRSNLPSPSNRRVRILVPSRSSISYYIQCS